jgi:hypothetical protein
MLNSLVRQSLVENSIGAVISAGKGKEAVTLSSSKILKMYHRLCALNLPDITWKVGVEEVG